MSTAEYTYWDLKPVNRYKEFLSEVEQYLKSNLPVTEVDGIYKYYDCGHNHQFPTPKWKPFRYLEPLCVKRDYDLKEVVILLSEYLGREIICECLVINDEEANRRLMLQKVYGVDFGEPDREDCGLIIGNEGG